MKRFAALTLVCTIAVSGCTAVEYYEPAVTAETGEEEPARPQDDFYRYVNEETLKNVEFKYGESKAGEAFNQDLIEDRVKGIIKEVVNGGEYEEGSEEDIIKRAYSLYLDYDFDNTPVPEDIASLFNDIKNASSVAELMKIDARMHRDYGITGILNCDVYTNYLEPGRNDICFRNYSCIITADFVALADSYSGLNEIRQIGSNAMQYMGFGKEEADGAGTSLGYLVMDIYNSTDMDIIIDSMPIEHFFEMTPDEAQAVFTNIDLNGYLADAGFDTSKCDRFSAIDRSQLDALNSMLTEQNLEALRAWEALNLIQEYNCFITPGSDLLLQYYSRDYREPEERAISEVIGKFYDQTDPLYVEKYYTDEMDTYLRSMCDDIKGGYRELIDQADWLTKETREGLLKKLDNIVYVTGKDLKRHDNAEFSAVKGSDYYELFRNYRKLLTQKRTAQLGTMSARDEISMPMQMFNACYSPSLNNITITVAMMNAPFFDITADYYTNLGGLGITIAHEMGHAFDSNCIVFDCDGRYDPSWLSGSDIEALEERNGTAVRYFEDNFTVFGVYHINGENTLGENYADLGGMECVISLAKTKEQREKVFTNYAAVWCEKQLDTEVLDQLEMDEHSPAVIRVNAILCTLDEFYETYDVKEGDGMYIAPENRISRWY